MSEKYFSTRTSTVILYLLIYFEIHMNASLKDEPLNGNGYPDPVQYIDALLDLCVAYDDGPSHVSRRLFARTFLRSVYS